MKSLKIAIDAIGLAAPGLDSFKAAIGTLKGDEVYKRQDLPRYKPTLLPPNERRRATSLVRLAFQPAEEALEHSAHLPATLASVFATSGGDMEIVDQICRAVHLPDHPVSPTRFHNSVHNAAAGYWGIATGSRQPPTTLSAYDDSFLVGLREAAAMAIFDRVPVMLVAYDAVSAGPFNVSRSLLDPFGVALILNPQLSDKRLATLEITAASSGAVESTLQDTGLEALRLGNPAARSLPLLAAIAAQIPATLHISAQAQPAATLLVCPND